MQKEFCTYETALALKEFGFNEECLCTILGGTSIFINGENPKLRYEFNYKFPNIEEGMFYRDNNNKLCCNKMYEISIPLWQQVIDWFREKHSVWIQVEMMYYDGVFYNYKIIQGNGKVTECEESSYCYEQSREQAILKAIELCKK